MRLPSTGLTDLSPRRRRILMQIVPSVVPSYGGQPAFRNIDAGWAPGKAHTTCGGLPALVATRLGLTIAMRLEGMGGGGLLSMRNAALKRGAWVHASRHSGAHGRAIAAPPGTLPKPGDLYMLCSGPGHERGCCLPQRVNDSDPWPAALGANIEHVGVVVDPSPSGQWLTADAGQGNSQMQMALYVTRRYSPALGTMAGEVVVAGRPMKRLCGWVDVDRYPFRDGWGVSQA